MEPSELKLLVREECGLCSDFIAEYTALGPALPPLVLQDVDSDAVLARRWGLKIPVLLLDGTLVCHGRLDRAEVLRLLGR